MNSTVTFEFVGFSKLLSLNDRMHWRPKAELNRCWRELAFYAAKSSAGPGRRGRSLVAVSLPVRSVNQRRDAHNFVATVKPILDGMVDAGVWPDDDGKWVVTEEPSFHAKADNPRVVVTITELPQ